MAKQPFWHPLAQDAGDFAYTPPAPACVGSADHQFYMGGAAMATHIAAMEAHFDKPLLWATIHFLNHGLLGEDMALRVEPVSGGRSVVQAMSTMRRGETVLHRTVAALGARAGEPDRAFVRMPDVLRPEACPVKIDDAMQIDGNLMTQFDRRTAYEDSVAGCEYMWIRPNFETRIDAPYLALVSDFFLGALPRTRRGTSLDNTFRLINLAETRWVLAVTQMSSFTRGAAHGTQHLFAENGTLLAVSSQTGLLPRPL